MFRGRFYNRLSVHEASDDGMTWEMLAPLYYRDTDGEVHKVPVGFRTDFASTPRLLWRVMPPMGRWNRAAAVHDYYCRTGLIPRLDADLLFDEMLEVLGVGWRRVPFYYGVRIGAWWAGKTT